MRLRTTMFGPENCWLLDLSQKSILSRCEPEPARRPHVRFMIATAFAVVLLLPAGARVQAASAPALTAQQGAASELSSSHTRKHKPKNKAAKKEEYLRAVPSGLPAGAKQ